MNVFVFVTQLAAFFSEQMNDMSLWMSARRYYRRMMRCMADQLEHQIHVSWYVYDQPPADEELAAVLNVPHVDDDDDTKEHEAAIGMTSNNYLLVSFIACCYPPVKHKIH